MKIKITSLDQLQKLLEGNYVRCNRWQKAGKDRLYINTGRKDAKAYAYLSDYGRVELSVWIDKGSQSMEWVKSQNRIVESRIESTIEESIEELEDSERDNLCGSAALDISQKATEADEIASAEAGTYREDVVEHAKRAASELQELANRAAADIWIALDYKREMEDVVNRLPNAQKLD